MNPRTIGLISILTMAFQLPLICQPPGETDFMQGFVPVHQTPVNVNVPDSMGTFPIHYAVDDFYHVQQLVGKGANVRVQDLDGDTALHWAAIQVDHRVIAYLINEGALVNARNKHGNTPLYDAASEGSIDIVKALVERGAFINNKNMQYDTPLHEAARGKNTEVYTYLVNSGADAHALNAQRETPESILIGPQITYKRSQKKRGFRGNGGGFRGGSGSGKRRRY